MCALFEAVLAQVLRASTIGDFELGDGYLNHVAVFNKRNFKLLYLQERI